MAKGFTRLLKKGVPFHWDQVAQASFDVVKDTLVQASLMYPPNYQSDYFLYVVADDMTIAMVLAQVEDGIEHPIYYLSLNLNDTEVKYSYVENLVLAVIQAVQSFRHTILFWKTIVISDCNPRTCILSYQLMGGNIQNGSSFCRNLIWNSSNPSQISL